MVGPLVLCYHAVSASWPAPLSVRPDRLADQVGRLVDRGWTGLTLSEALERPRRRTFAVTFDDAFKSVVTAGKPILDSFGVPATVFVPTAWPGRSEPMTWPGIDHWSGGPHESELRCIDWDRLRELAAEGWEIGSHTVTHPQLTRLDDEALAQELSASRGHCEEALGRPCPALAYPYGDVDARVAHAAAQAGYRHGATLAVHPPLPLRWPRVGLYHRDTGTRAALKLSPAVYWARTRVGALAVRRSAPPGRRRRRQDG